MDKEFAERVVKDAGELLLTIRGAGFTTGVKHGDWKDTVTSADLEVNKFIIERIRAEYPEDHVHSEEGGGDADAARMWHVDPIDGSSNFARAIPHFAICVGLVEGGVPTAGAIYNPVTRELFSFTRGGGAFVNGVQVKVSAVTDLRESYALLTAGRKDDVREWGGESYKKLLANIKKTKNLGSSALDICFVGAGRVEVLVYGTLTTKDIAPALGFLYEAGGVATDEAGQPLAFSSEPQRVYAANNKTVLDSVRTLLQAP